MEFAVAGFPGVELLRHAGAVGGGEDESGLAGVLVEVVVQEGEGGGVVVHDAGADDGGGGVVDGREDAGELAGG